MSDQLVDRINAVRFTPVRLREGYEMDGVDRFLAEADGTALPTSGEQALARDLSATPPVIPSVMPAVIEEHPSTLSRLFRRKR